MYICWKLIQELKKSLKKKTKKLYNGICRINATYAFSFQIGMILEMKCNSNAFLLKIDQRIAKNLENKQQETSQRIIVN